MYIKIEILAYAACYTTKVYCLSDTWFSLLQDFKIQNIVGSCDVKFPIRLEGLAYSHGAFSSVSDESMFIRVHYLVFLFCYLSVIGDEVVL